MKRIISVLVAVVLVATMVLSFPMSTRAIASNNFNLLDSHADLYFVTDDTQRHAEVYLTVSRTGYYIIQSFGFFDSDWDSVSTGTYVELYSSDEYITDSDSELGYEAENFFFYVHLEAGETYRLYISISNAVSYGRLSVTNAATSFIGNSHAENYYSIMSLNVEEGYNTYTFGFTAQDTQRAVAHLLVYSPMSDVAPRSISAFINITACDCTRVALVDPRGHDNLSAGGHQIVYDLEDCRDGVSLEADVPYYFVTYLGNGEELCWNHLDYLLVTVSIEAA